MIVWGKPREDANAYRSETAMEILSGFVATFLLVFAAIAMLYRLSEEQKRPAMPHDVVLVAVIALVLCLLEPFLRRTLSSRRQNVKKTARILYGGMAGVFLLAAGLFFAIQPGKVISGLKAMASAYLLHFNVSFKTAFGAGGGNEEYFSLAACFCALVLFFACYCFSDFGRRKQIFILIPAVSMFLIMSVGLAPTWAQIAAALVGGYLICRMLAGHMGVRMTLVQTGVLCAVLLSVGWIMEKQTEEFQKMARGTKEYQEKLEKTVAKGYLDLTSPKRKTITNGKPKYTDVKMMTVRMGEEPVGNLYFKTYVGTHYDNGEWNSEVSSFRAACRDNDINYGKAASILAASLWERVPAGRTTYQLEFTNKLGKTLPLPYGMDAESAGNVNREGDLEAKRNVFKGKAEFRGMTTNAFALSDLRTAAENVRYLGLEEQALWEWYGEYVEDTCLDVPDYVKNLRAYQEIRSNLELYSTDVNSRRINAANAVSSYLREHYVYRWDLDELGDGVDPIEYFLEEGGKGYCIHFASAGTLLLREMGIPTRYVSGFVVKDSAATKGKDGMYEAVVIDRHSHAWVEIYLENLGWIPVEMTPGYEEGSIEDPTSDEAEWLRMQKEAGDVPGAAESGADHVDIDIAEILGLDEIEVSPVDGSLTLIISGVSMLLLLILGIILYRSLSGRRFRNALNGKQYQKAVLIINRRVWHRLRYRHGIKGSCRTDREFESRLFALMGEKGNEDVLEYVRIVKMAKYSDHVITKEDCEAVWRCYRKFLLI